MTHCGNDETGQNALFGKYLNNRQTGKDATKPRTLGLLGYSDEVTRGYNYYQSDRTVNGGIYV